jgi:dinuclear metal center YbgI/SA1388 family protein
MVASVADIIKMVEMIAPRRLAENWDNAGLQIGKCDWPVRKVWVALDPLPEVVEAACNEEVDFLITHHPLIFKPLSRIDVDTPTGSILQQSIEHRMAIYAAHTNLDSAMGGVNDVLAARIGLNNLKVLAEGKAPELLKLVIFAPSELEQKTIEQLSNTTTGPIQASPARIIQNKGYRQEGTHSVDVVGTGIDGPGGDAVVRIEVPVVKSEIGSVLGEIARNKDLERISYDLHRLLSPFPKEGLGRIGDLEKGSDLRSFAQAIKQKLELASVAVAGNPNMPVYKAAICSGSGSSLLNVFFASKAQVFVTGDLRYHDARTAEAAGRGVIDIGHYPSERLIVDVLVDTVRQRSETAGFKIRVEACRLENDPFMII